MPAPVAAILAIALFATVGCETKQPDPAPIYTYTGAQGRSFFTDDPVRIPQEYRASAKIMDLSHVSLNHELAEELAAQARLGALATTDVCQDAAEASSGGWLHYVRLKYRQHPASMALAALALLLIITAPFLARRVGARTWMRVLALLLPMLLALAVFTYAVTGLRSSHKREQHTAEACTHGKPERVPRDHRDQVVRKLRKAYLQSSSSADRALELDR